ncbi:MAG: CHASE2 domain-containing protein [Saprospiraceae bacterium]|nr:CHASE2 domain-containing protein [Candidatus Vicinibacter affinis]
MNQFKYYHGFVFSIISVLFLFLLHHLPVNQLFIDPFSEAIKHQDLIDVSFSKFRDHSDPKLFDSRIFIINSGITDRRKVATAINFLSRKSTKVIGIDLLFDTLYSTPADTLLRNAILSSPKLTLAYSFEEAKLHKPSTMEMHSHPFFTKSDNQAYVNLATNDGFSVRTFEPFHNVEGNLVPSFSTKIALIFNPDILSSLNARGVDKEWINFRRVQPGVSGMIYPINSGQNSHYALVNIDQFLNDTSSYDDNYFKDKIVLVGFCGEHDASLSMKDRYYTPLNERSSGRSIPDMFGVIIHANIISMLLDEDYIDDVPEWLLYLFSFFIFFINYYIFLKVVEKKLFFTVAFIRLIQILQFVFLYSCCILLLCGLNIKLGFILIITSVILSFELFEFYQHRFKHRVNKILSTY